VVQGLDGLAFGALKAANCYEIGCEALALWMDEILTLERTWGTENSQSSTKLPGSTRLHVIAASIINGDNCPRVLLWDRYKSLLFNGHRSCRFAGGLHYALKKSSVDARVLAAFDWDQLASRVYSHNFPETIVKQVHVLPSTRVELQLKRK